MTCTPWDLEPRFGPDLHGTNISVVLTTVFYQPGQHLCHTEIHDQPVFTNCVLQKGNPSHSVLQGLYQHVHGQHWIVMTKETRTFPRSPPEMQGLYKVVDACSGIAAVTEEPVEHPSVATLKPTNGFMHGNSKGRPFPAS